MIHANYFSIKLELFFKVNKLSYKCHSLCSKFYCNSEVDMSSIIELLTKGPNPLFHIDFLLCEGVLSFRFFFCCVIVMLVSHVSLTCGTYGTDMQDKNGCAQGLRARPRTWSKDRAVSLPGRPPLHKHLLNISVTTLPLLLFSKVLTLEMAFPCIMALPNYQRMFHSKTHKT